MNNAYGLKAVQEVNLKLLKEVARICDKYRIAYFLDAGTLLGAIRHGGFIPWDDDADIVMTRNNWEAFRKVAGRELQDGMKLILPTQFAGGTRFFDFTPRVIYEGTRRRKPDVETKFYEEKLNRLWVDIFILDRLPNEERKAKNRILLQKILYGFAMGHRQKIDFKKYSGFQKIAVFVLSAVGRRLPMRQIFFLQDKLSKRSNRKRTDNWYYSNYDPGFIDIRMKNKWVENRTEIRFEDTTFSIPEHYDEVLTSIYGDYMKLPPEEKREPSHGSTEIEIYG